MAAWFSRNRLTNYVCQIPRALPRKTESNLPKHQPLKDKEPAAQARDIMNQAFADATVVKYEQHGIEIRKLPDEGDRHVIAAAIKSKADIIVTENLKDFPRKVLAKYGIEAKSSLGLKQVHRPALLVSTFRIGTQRPVHRRQIDGLFGCLGQADKSVGSAFHPRSTGDIVHTDWD